MNNNPNKLLVSLFIILVAALTGCGGTDEPSSQVIVVPGEDSGTDQNNDTMQCLKSLGDECETEGEREACLGYICHCGKWTAEANTSIPCDDAGTDTGSEAGEDAESDVNQPDADAEVPDAPPAEICDGIDNTGNGIIDDGFECSLGKTAMCQTTCGSVGETTCQAGTCTWSDCVPPAEICGNGIDDNCNGKTDCADPACTSLTACQTEICDGVDNNGNGQIDEGFECRLGNTGLCQTACGTTGMITCVAGCKWSACTPPTEICNNGIDDNCNGKVDCADPACANHSQCYCEAPTFGAWCTTPYVPGDFHSCAHNMRCDCTFKWAYTANGDFSCINQEVCNGFDDNGNGQIDEGFECPKGTKQNCSTSCGTTGQKTCSNTCQWGACVLPVEICGNGIDDNCNGKVDCADPACSGMLHCQTEICDGVDNNGNGQIDEGFECIKGSAPVACFTSCGSTGTKPCLANCSYGACTPPVENCFNGVDDDCDGKADCADADCAGMQHCQTEICDGVDNNGNGQIDEGFECIKGSAPVACTTSCGSTGTKPCLANCSYGSCQPPVENCSNGVDDDCDGKVDCADPDCANAQHCKVEICDNGIDDDGNGKTDCADPACDTDPICHDFGNCPVQAPSSTAYTCGNWEQDTVPNSIFLIDEGCANSEFNQWAIGGTYTDVKVIRLTGNHTWVDMPLPIHGVHYAGYKNIMCLGSNNVFMLYNSDNGGTILHWNGSSLYGLIASELNGIKIAGLWGTGTNNLWFVGYGTAQGYPIAYIYKWDGSKLSQHDLPSFGNKIFRGYKFFGTATSLYLSGMEFDPNDYGNPATHKSVLLHWDGKSWAKHPGTDTLQAFYGLHGTSSCDVMAVGSKHTGNGYVGATVQRNGNQWVTTTHDISTIVSVVKISPHKFVLQGHESDGGHGYLWTGTPKADASLLWSRNYSFVSEGSDFWHGGASWKVPGTSIIMQGGDGIHGANEPSGSGTYAHILRSTCQ